MMRPRERNSRRSGSPGLGGASLLLMFAALCLSAFALLTLVTARDGHRLAAASLQAAADYYAADSRAEEVLAALRVELAAGRPAPAEIAGAAITALGGDEYAYQLPAGEGQALDIRVRVGADGAYSVLAWRLTPLTEWRADDSLPVWQGD